MTKKIKVVTYCGSLAWRTNADVYGEECEITVGYTLCGARFTGLYRPHCFEVSDIETGGNNIYEEGSLIFEDNELVDYDGVCELAIPIIDILEHKGFNVAHIKETLEV